MPGPALFIHAQFPLNSKCYIKAHCKLYSYTRDACGLENYSHEKTAELAPKGFCQHSCLSSKCKFCSYSADNERKYKW